MEVKRGREKKTRWYMTGFSSSSIGSSSFFSSFGSSPGIVKFFERMATSRYDLAGAPKTCPSWMHIPFWHCPLSPQGVPSA